MTIERFERAWLVAVALLLAILASPAFSQLAQQKPNVTVYASPT